MDIVEMSAGEPVQFYGDVIDLDKAGDRLGGKAHASLGRCVAGGLAPGSVSVGSEGRRQPGAPFCDTVRRSIGKPKSRIRQGFARKISP